MLVKWSYQYWFNKFQHEFRLWYINPLISFTCNPVATSFMSLWDRSRKLSTRSPSMKPSHGSVFTSVVKERQKPWSILPTGLMVWVSLSCSSYRNSNSSLLIWVTSPVSIKASITFIFHKYFQITMLTLFLIHPIFGPAQIFFIKSPFQRVETMVQFKGCEWILSKTAGCQSWTTS